MPWRQIGARPSAITMPILLWLYCISRASYYIHWTNNIRERSRGQPPVSFFLSVTNTFVDIANQHPGKQRSYMDVYITNNICIWICLTLIVLYLFSGMGCWIAPSHCQNQWWVFPTGLWQTLSEIWEIFLFKQIHSFSNDMSPNRLV